MERKEELIKQIQNFDNKYFNQDQKAIITRILEDTSDNNVQEIFDFLIMKKGIGFNFDSSPEIAQGRIISLKEIENKRINIDNRSEDDNLLLIGDNYNALKALNITHKSKVDIIYIDPPYNTDSASSDGNQSSKEEVKSTKFIYKDKFGRNGWLNMMRDRLTLAKSLLTDDGTIFVSIDDNEYAYLKVLMDDIFDENLYITSFPRITTNQGNKQSSHITKQYDYIICYSKSEEFSKQFTDDSWFTLDDNDGRGKYHLKNHIAATVGLGYVETLDFEIEIDGNKYNPVLSDGTHTRWLWNKERIKKGNELGILVERNGLLYRKNYKDYDFDENNELSPKKASIPFNNLELILDMKYSNRQGTRVLDSVLGKGKFDFPKSTEMIKWLLNLFKDNKNLTVLDFFAGSGTTGHAVMELNKDDGGNRKFILCTNNEKDIADNVTYERLHRIMKGISTTKDKNFKWIEKNDPFENETLSVIEISDDMVISLDQNLDMELLDKKTNELNLLDIKYEKTGLNLYYDLAALNPLEKDDESN